LDFGGRPWFGVARQPRFFAALQRKISAAPPPQTKQSNKHTAYAGKVEEHPQTIGLHRNIERENLVERKERREKREERRNIYGAGREQKRRF